MPPPIFTDDYIRRMCPETRPIPMKVSHTFAVTEPTYLAKGLTGIKYVAPPVQPPPTMNVYARALSGHRSGIKREEAVQSITERVRSVVAEAGARRMVEVSDAVSDYGSVMNDMFEEEGKAELETDYNSDYSLASDLTPDDAGGAAEDGAPNSMDSLIGYSPKIRQFIQRAAAVEPVPMPPHTDESPEEAARRRKKTREGHNLSSSSGFRGAGASGGKLFEDDY